MAVLTIRFRGVCTHFTHLVPGVPHRVVLPNATAIRFGLVDMPGARSTLPYALLPHFAVLRLKDEAMQSCLEVPGVMELGVIYDAVRLQVANASGHHVEYVDYHDVARIAYYVDAYQFSDEVVLGGRASCYFDVLSGTVASDRLPNEKIAGVKITIETHGPPTLLAMPFFQRTDRRNAVTRIELGSGDTELIVGNIGPGCGDGGADGFDFLLNYLTLKGGLPRALRVQPPHPLKPVPPPEAVAKAIELLGDVIARRPVVLPDFDTMLLSEVLSCSNTQYP